MTKSTPKRVGMKMAKISLTVREPIIACVVALLTGFKKISKFKNSSFFKTRPKI